MAQPQPLQLSDWLIEANLLTKQQLEKALSEQKEQGATLEQTLLELGYLKEKDVVKFLSQQHDIPFVDLAQFHFDAESSQLLPEPYARHLRAIVLKDQGETLLVGMANPADIMVVDELKRVLKKPPSLAFVVEGDLHKALDLVYRRTKDISGFAEELHEEIAGENEFELESLEQDAGKIDAPVINLIRSLFEDAIQVGASDIHLEQTEQGLRIRQRIDGMLQGQLMKEKDIGAALAQRLKLMSGLNIAEKRLPQDGRFTIRSHDNNVDVRLSTLPTPLGETVVMRLLNLNASSFVSLESLGLPSRSLEAFKKLVQSPHGVILVTGPTGSGKSTTLYSVLKGLDAKTQKIITIEDPIEYKLENVVQTQVQSKIDLSFARILRACLRQDPDVLMVGEIRDEETASIAMRAALTGHLVFSTLHTNDAASTAVRLLDMGIQGFLVVSTLLGVLAQRLVRRICENCTQDYQPNEQEKVFLDSISGETVYTDMPFKQGKGCAYCNHTGFKGRIGIFELLILDAEMMEALRRNDPTQFVDIAKKSLKGKLLLDGGLEHAAQGLTTVSEVMRITGEFS